MIKNHKLQLILLFILIAQSKFAIGVPEIETWNTSQGARVLFIETHSLPMVDIRVVFSAGSARDTDKPGVALLTNALMSSGAGKLNADDIAERLEDVGANMSNEALRDMAMVSLRTLTEPAKLQQALNVMQVVVTQPTFPERDLARDKERLLASIKRKQQSPEAIATDAFYAALYGDHPYARPSEGTEESIAKIRRSDLKDFHQQYYVGRNAVVAVVGDLTRASAEKYVEQLLHGLTEGSVPEPIPPVPALKEGQEIRIPMPTTQTTVIMGQPGMKRGDDDYYALYVGNHILGGSGFASRLMQTIREDRGLVYDVHSYFLPMAGYGPFQAGMQTRNEQVEEALLLLHEQISSFIEQGPTAVELEKSVKNITGSFPLNIDSNSNLVSYLAMIGFYNLPLDYLNTFNKHVKEVTVAKIKDAFTRRMHPERFVTILVGGGVSTGQ